MIMTIFFIANGEFFLFSNFYFYRVLKPPGGECSISFTDESIQRKQSSENGGAISPQDCDSSSSVEEATAATPTSKTTTFEVKDSSGTEAAEASPVAEEASPRPDSEDSTLSHETPAEITKEPGITEPDSLQQTSTNLATFNESNVLGASCQVAENGSSISNHSEYEVSAKDTFEIKKETCINQTSTETTIEKCETTASVSCESHKATIKTSTAEEQTIVNTNKNSPEVAHVQQNGSNSAKTSSPESASLDMTTSSAATPAPPATTDRMFGEAPSTTRQNPPPPRKIKDHMRSNIFISDEEYMPTRSSRMNGKRGVYSCYRNNFRSSKIWYTVRLPICLL